MENFSPVVQKEKHKFKALTFISALLTLGIAVLCVICAVYFVAVVYPNWMGSNNEVANVIAGIFLAPLVIIGALILGIGAILYLVLGIILMIGSFKDDKSFSKIKGLLITTIVFDVLIGIILCIAATIKEVQILFLILLAVLLVSMILKIVEMVLHSRRMKSMSKTTENQPQDSQKSEEIIQPQSTIDFSALSDDDKTKE